MSNSTNSNQINIVQTGQIDENQQQIHIDKNINSLNQYRLNHRKKKIQKTFQSNQQFVQKEKQFRFHSKQKSDIKKNTNKIKNTQKVQSQGENQQIQVQQYLSNPISEKHQHMIMSVNSKLLSAQKDNTAVSEDQKASYEQQNQEINKKKEYYMPVHETETQNLTDTSNKKFNKIEERTKQQKKQEQYQEEIFESVYQENFIQRNKTKYSEAQIHTTYNKYQTQQIISEQQQNNQYQPDINSEAISFKQQTMFNKNQGRKEEEQISQQKLKKQQQLQKQQKLQKQLQPNSQQEQQKLKQQQLTQQQKQQRTLQQKSEQTIIQFDFQNKKINQYSFPKKNSKEIRKNIKVQEQNKMNIKQVDLNAFYVSNSQNLYPSLSLHSERSQKNNSDQLPIKIKIHSYRVQQFLKMETQVYQIIVYGKNQNYQIQRRYSDFLFLFQSIITNHLGYVLYPFPLKNVDSFLKIKLSIGESTQKYQLIQKRIKQLEQFVNYLIFHQDLRNSQQLGIFLVQDQQLFQKGKSRIEKYVEQYNQLQNLANANIQNFISGGLSFVKSWIGKESSQQESISLPSKKMSKQDLQFAQRIQIVNNQIENYKKILQLANNLLETQKKLTEFHDVETEFDQLLKLSTKLASGKQYCRYFHDWLQNQMIDQVNFVLRSLNQIQNQLTKRSSLVELTFLAQKSNENTKKSKLKRRIQRFDTNFNNGFQDFIKNCKKQYQQRKIKFKKTWEQHRKKMMKIWN